MPKKKINRARIDKQKQRNLKRSFKAQVNGEHPYRAEIDRYKGDAVVASGVIFRRKEYPRRFGQDYLTVKTHLGAAFQSIAPAYAFYLRGEIPGSTLLAECEEKLKQQKAQLAEKGIKLGDVKILAQDVIDEMDRTEFKLRRNNGNQ